MIYVYISTHVLFSYFSFNLTYMYTPYIKRGGKNILFIVFNVHTY